MTGSGQKTCLAEVGLLSPQSCFFQLGIGFAEFVGPLLNALFQRFINQLQLVFDILEVGDIGKRGDITATGYRVAAYLEDPATQPLAFVAIILAAAQMIQAFLYFTFVVIDQTPANVELNESAIGFPM